MQTQPHPSTGDRLGREDNEVHAAVRFGVLAAVAGLGPKKIELYGEQLIAILMRN